MDPFQCSQKQPSSNPRRGSRRHKNSSDTGNIDFPQQAASHQRPALKDPGELVGYSPHLAVIDLMNFSVDTGHYRNSLSTPHHQGQPRMFSMNRAHSYRYYPYDTQQQGPSMMATRGSATTAGAKPSTISQIKGLLSVRKNPGSHPETSQAAFPVRNRENHVSGRMIPQRD